MGLETDMFVPMAEVCGLSYLLIDRKALLIMYSSHDPKALRICHTS